MKNCEMYVGVKERVEGFKRWMSLHDIKEERAEDVFVWLEEEAGYVPTLECPYCGKETRAYLCKTDNCGVVRCLYCGYESGHAASMHGAIFNHNNIVRTMRNAKEQKNV